MSRLTCPGQLWLVAKFTSGGKSTFARDIALNATRGSHPVLSLPLEMSEDEVTDGLVCTVGCIDSQGDTPRTGVR